MQGFGKTTLYWGGGIAEKGLFHEDTTNPDRFYGDKEEDYEHIALGIQMFDADYPDYPDIGFDGIPTDENWLEEVASILSGST